EPAGDEQRLSGAHLQQAPHGDRAEQAAAHDAHDDHEHRAPREGMSEITSRRPRKAMPSRSSLLEASGSPGAVDSGRRTTLVSAIPATIATISGLTPGRNALTVIAMSTAPKQSRRPGKYFCTVVGRAGAAEEGGGVRVRWAMRGAFQRPRRDRKLSITMP